MARPSDQPLETLLQRTERTYVKLVVFIILGLCMVVALVWGGHRFYVGWQEHKLMRQAHVAFDKNDLRWASMAAQRAFAVDPTSSDACRTLAAIAEKQNNPEAIDWRRRVVALNPNSVADRVALAESALRLQQPAIAAEALAPIPPAQQEDANYQATAAHLALTKNDFAAAEKHFRAAVRLAPNDPERQLELAEFQLRSGESAKGAEGRALAQRLKSDAHVRLSALRVLINDAVRSRDTSASIALAKELSALPDSTFNDRLLALGLLRGVRDPGFSAALTRLEEESAQSVGKAVSLLNWMTSQGLSLLAVDWSKRLPPEVLGNLPFRFALATAYMQLGDWAALRGMLQGNSWGRAESLRLAFQAKVARETGDNVGFEKSWVNAVAQTGNDIGQLNMLQNVAFQWKWPEKGTAVLWMLVEIPEAQREALQKLYLHYAEVRDTTGLYRALVRLVAVLPHDPAVRNNFAQISLLVKAEIQRALGVARELHQSHPQNAAYASTYAFGLFRTGDLKGALKVMSQLRQDQVNDPSVAAYYGIILSGAGQTEEAAYFLDLGATAKLLPEEEELVARARNALARQEPPIRPGRR
ncbi:MAG: hypothetical protein ABI787_11235 [Spartobacteria bacterium]